MNKLTGGMMRVDIWSDIACPFCYIGKAQFERAVENFAHKDKLEVVYHSFQLDTTLPRDYEGSIYEMLAKKLGRSVDEAKQMNQAISEQAKSYDLEFDMDKLVVTNTADAHRLIHFATEKGKQSEIIDRLYRAYFTEGKHVGDQAVLAKLAADIGIDKDEALKVLSGDNYTREVETDMAQAAQLGISGVPFYVINQKYGLSGAQGEEVFTEALQKAWHEEHPLQMVGSDDAAVCADGVCTA